MRLLNHRLDDGIWRLSFSAAMSEVKSAESRMIMTPLIVAN